MIRALTKGIGCFFAGSTWNRCARFRNRCAAVLSQLSKLVVAFGRSILGGELVELVAVDASLEMSPPRLWLPPRRFREPVNVTKMSTAELTTTKHFGAEQIRAVSRKSGQHVSKK